MYAKITKLTKMEAKISGKELYRVMNHCQFGGPIIDSIRKEEPLPKHDGGSVIV
ncbi:hypothetical protein EXN66_Car011982 [Channa argus]|uniref:Uncharacterized protein n=1 Tax=Channa argus TaxID=215402 RepID=A0A6G1Q1A5_CHAAH|nr:hypothetical protein EXN66_Car011982 [Channa argus]